MKKFLTFVLFAVVFSVNGAETGGNALSAKNIPSASVESNAVLAAVNGEVITLLDVLPLTYQREQQARSVYSGERLLKEIGNYRKIAVDDLVDNILIRAEFNKYNFVLSPHDIEREIDDLAVRSGCQSRVQLEKQLVKDGSSIAELRLSIRKNMMVQLMIFRQIKIADPVSPRELYEYFTANGEKFSTPAKVSLAMLKLDSSRKDLENDIRLVDETLKKDPEQFSALVKQYSPSLGNGELGEIECQLLRPEFAAAFKEFIPGKIAGPVKVYDGVVWLKVISYTAVVKVSFAEAEPMIRMDLERAKRERIIKDYAEKLRANALVEYYF